MPEMVLCDPSPASDRIVDSRIHRTDKEQLAKNLEIHQQHQETQANE